MQENKEELNAHIQSAVSGDKQSIETLLTGVQDAIFNLSLRMLGTIPDAEDATQDILIRIMTSLSTFRFESKFSTWVYRLASNYLIDYKKSMLARHPLDFDYYSYDLKASYTENTDELIMGVTKEAMAQELKLSCTNVMLQCFDPQTRCIFILGAMFKIDSRLAGEILGITPENYRQKLSRARKKMAEFLSYHCGLTDTGFCSCKKRIGYAMQHNRINPRKLEYAHLEHCNENALLSCMEHMEALEEMADVFADLPNYRSPVSAKTILCKLLKSPRMKAIQDY